MHMLLPFVGQVLSTFLLFHSTLGENLLKPFLLSEPICSNIIYIYANQYSFGYSYLQFGKKKLVDRFIIRLTSLRHLFLRSAWQQKRQQSLPIRGLAAAGTGNGCGCVCVLASSAANATVAGKMQLQLQQMQ